MEAGTTRIRAARRVFPPIPLERVAQVAAATALLTILAGSALIVVLASQGHSFLSPAAHHRRLAWMNWPFGGLWSDWPHTRDQIYSILLLTILVTTVCYVVAIRFARSLPGKVVAGVVIAVYLVFFLSPPLLLTDVFNYVEYARMGVLHGLNPYTHIPLDARADPVWKLSNWHHLPSPYGPLFTLITYPLAPLGIAGAFWAYKALLLLVSLGCAGLVALIARQLQRPAATAVVIVALNPLVLIYGAGGQHMDMFNMLFVLGAIYLALANRERLGSAAMIGAAAAKASAAVLAPVAIAAGPRRIRSLAGAAAGLGMAGFVCLMAFGPHPPAIADQSRLVTALSIPNITGLLLGHGGEDAAVRTATHVLLAVTVVACTVWAWRSRRLIEPLGWLTLVTLATLGWDMPWYLLWLLPFVAFVRSRTFRVASVLVAVWMTIQWLPYSYAVVARIGLHPGVTHTWKTNRLYVRTLLK